MKTLITFLGKGRGIQGKYNRTVYRLDADFQDEVPYIGFALAKYLQPDRILILGTAGSMWDVFLEDTNSDGDTFLELVNAVAEARVTEDLLQKFDPAISAAIGKPVELAIIPMARNLEEQTGILERMAKTVHPGEEIYLDVTHGFRHLPMLGLVAARYLSRVRQVQVKEIFYGAYEMRGPDNVSPVLHMSGLLTLLDWVDALANYDKDGDYGAFANLLRAEGLDRGKANLLEQAAFFERTTNPVRARECLNTVSSALSEPLGTCAELFRHELLDRISWRKKPQRNQWEAELSQAYLKRGDFLRAAIYGLEAQVSKAAVEHKSTTKDKLSVNSYNDREYCRKLLWESKNKHFRTLNHLRNAMCHGVKGSDQTTRALATESELANTLGEMLKDP